MGFESTDIPTLAGRVQMPTPNLQPAMSVIEQLSRPYRLPSGGLLYGKHDGAVIIRPMRGEQEEIIAGAADSPTAYVETLKHVIQQCVDLKGLSYDNLLLLDWTALMLNFLALSNGSDEANLSEKHDLCGKTSEIKIALTNLPCVALRYATDGMEATFGDLAEEDPELRAMREIEEADVGYSERVLSPGSFVEPFVTKPLPVSGTRISWRFHRVNDYEKAQEFASRANDVRSKLHTYLLARQIVAINDKKVSSIEAIQWVRQQPTPILSALRDEIDKLAFGYDMNPRLKCQHCGARMEMRLRLDADLFRKSSRKKI